MRILNLFAGIGGNRALWGSDHEITAIEYDPEIAGIYQKRFPDDTVHVTDAYSYFEDNFMEFDFIWASPSCLTHTNINRVLLGYAYSGRTTARMFRMPDFRLWSLIAFLQNLVRAEFVVENVKPYYKPFISPTFELGRHYYWASRYIQPVSRDGRADVGKMDKMVTIEELCDIHHIDIEMFGEMNREKIHKLLRNCVKPLDGKAILDAMLSGRHQTSLSRWMK